MMDQILLETLRTAQRFGFGSRPIEEAAAHSMAYVDALQDPVPPARLVDLGSGGGLPGLVIASAFPDTSVLLLDRRQKRTDFLELAIVKLGLRHVEVRCADVSALISDVRAGVVAPFDAVTARGFGPPEFTLRSGLALIAVGGRVLISEPPSEHRWSQNMLSELGVQLERRGAVGVFSMVV